MVLKNNTQASPNTQGRRCAVCNGTGYCSMCKGKGWYETLSGSIFNCSECHQDGRCRVCYGKGHY